MTRHRKKGFSLLEAAVVLGVVGLVIGGIWVAASEVKTNQIVSEIVAGTNQYVQGVRSLTKDTSFSWVVSSENSGQFRLDAGLVPASWAVTGTYYNVAPGGVLVGLGGRDAIDRTLRSIGLFYTFDSKQRGLCRRLLVALSHDYANINMVYGYSGLTAIYPFGGAMFTNLTLSKPIAISNAGVSTICNATASGATGPVFTIGWKQ